MPGKVLIIDDIATNRITFKVRLAAACYQVAQAATAAEGLTLARQMPPDLILCPANLPDMDAAGLCLLYTSPSPRDQRGSRMPSSA